MPREDEMSDEPASADETFAGRVQRTGRSSDGPVTQAEIDDVLNDERLSAAEREARLTDLRQRVLDGEHADGDDQYAPLQTRIMDALSMLAEGGHDYDGSLRVEAEEDDGSGNAEVPADSQADRRD